MSYNSNSDLMGYVWGLIVMAGFIGFYLLLYTIIQKISPSLAYTLFHRRFTPLGTFNQDDDERAHEPFVIEPLTDSEQEWLEWLLKNTYSAIPLGPFSAMIERKLAAKDGHRVAESMHYKTIFRVQITPVQNYSFTIDFRHRIRKDISRREFQKKLTVLCYNSELKPHLLSPEFIDAIFRLNSFAPGSIQCANDSFCIQLNRTLKDEAQLDAFVDACRAAFVKYAQQVQLYLPTWRGHDWWGESGSQWHKPARQENDGPARDTLHGDMGGDIHGLQGDIRDHFLGDHLQRDEALPALEEARRQ